SDPILLGRVIGNMVKNALEAIEPGQAITLGCRIIGEGVEFWVHNPGFMPPSVQLQLFQRSFSTKGKGRGLGTYSMKLLSERYLHGSVSFTSSLETGTTFVGRYPLNLPISH
ncbi:MAG: ATP-binding protein, partial [Anaerolineae bacterium]|nr:ATP-binding protein [Anaerolineae bacterium]